jgi:hypothetical protein
MTRRPNTRRVPVVAAAALTAALTAALAATADRASAQQLRLNVTQTSLQNTVTPPTITDFQASTGAVRRRSAGTVTFDVQNCTGGRTCTVSVSATTFPAAAANQLTWTVENFGAGANIACGASPVSTVGGSPSPVVACVATATDTGGQSRTATGIVVRFEYPVSWTNTPNGTYSTAGLALQVTSR